MPAAPMRSASVTRTPASSTLYWASEPMVICWVRVTPGGRRGRPGTGRRRSGASPVRASTTSRDADEANATCRLVPVMVHPSPSGTARTWTPVGPRAVLGLQPRRGEDGLARHDAGEPRLLLVGAARAGQHAARQDRADEVGRRGDGPAELLVDDDALEGGHARAAVLLGELQADQVEVGELLPQLGRVADRVVLELAHHAERAGGGDHAAHRLTEHLLLGAEGQVQHVVFSSGGAVVWWCVR